MSYFYKVNDTGRIVINEYKPSAQFTITHLILERHNSTGWFRIDYILDFCQWKFFWDDEFY